MAGNLGSELLLNVDQARRRLLTFFSPVSEESVQIGEGLGRVLSRPIVSPTDLPLFTHSSMDGFAVRVADVKHVQEESPIVLKVIEDIPAGSRPRHAGRRR
jgi:molybdopterin molybdotransferase